MKLKYIAATALSAMLIASASSAETKNPVNMKKTPTIADVQQKTDELRKSLDNVKAALANASKSPQETIANFDKSIAAAQLILNELGENGPVAKSIDEALKINKDKMKLLEEKSRTNPKLGASMADARNRMQTEIDKLYRNKLTVIDTQSQVIKKLKEFEQGKEAYSLLSSLDELGQANELIDVMVKGMVSLGESLDNFQDEKEKAPEQSVPSKN